MITMNGNGQGDARARLNVPVHGWAPGLRWPMQNRRICTVADLPELGWAADHIGREDLARRQPAIVTQRDWRSRA